MVSAQVSRLPLAEYVESDVIFAASDLFDELLKVFKRDICTLPLEVAQQDFLEVSPDRALDTFEVSNGDARVARRFNQEDVVGACGEPDYHGRVVEFRPCVRSSDLRAERLAAEEQNVERVCHLHELFLRNLLLPEESGRNRRQRLRLKAIGLVNVLFDRVYPQFGFSRVRSSKLKLEVVSDEGNLKVATNNKEGVELSAKKSN